MKKLFLSLITLLALGTAVQAQDYDITTGLRIGYGHHAAVTMEVSAQAFVNDINRVEVDLGLRLRNHFTKKVGDESYEEYLPIGPILTSSWQWHWFLAGGFGIYGGPTLQLSVPAWHHFSMGAGGQVGIDYQFDAPFQLALDFRPIYNFFGPYRGFDPNVGVSIRYSF